MNGGPEASLCGVPVWAGASRRWRLQLGHCTLCGYYCAGLPSDSVPRSTCHEHSIKRYMNGGGAGESAQRPARRPRPVACKALQASGSSDFVDLGLGLSFKAVPRGVVRVSVWLPRCCVGWCAVRWVLVDGVCPSCGAPLVRSREKFVRLRVRPAGPLKSGSPVHWRVG